MSYFGLSDVNAANTLFSSMGASASRNTGLGGSANIGTPLSDYASIRNGSYFKLLKAYYKKEDSELGNLVNSSTATSKDSTKKLTKIEGSAEALKESADALVTKGSKSIFKETDIKQEDGTVSKGYQKDAIYAKVNDFVKDYNTLIEDTEESNTTSVARASVQMINLTKANERLLEDVGITINKDDTLSIDKETFLNADMNKVKSLFNGNGSYAYNVSVKASMIDYHAQNEASKANTYSGNGAYNYNYSSGSNYSNYI